MQQMDAVGCKVLLQISLGLRQEVPPRFYICPPVPSGQICCMTRGLDIWWFKALKYRKCNEPRIGAAKTLDDKPGVELQFIAAQLKGVGLESHSRSECLDEELLMHQPASELRTQGSSPRNWTEEQGRMVFKLAVFTVVISHITSISGESQFSAPIFTGTRLMYVWFFDILCNNHCQQISEPPRLFSIGEEVGLFSKIFTSTPCSLFQYCLSDAFFSNKHHKKIS